MTIVEMNHLDSLISNPGNIKICGKEVPEPELFCDECKLKYPKACDALVREYRRSLQIIKTGVWISQ